ncbi:MAG: RodZ domain-containing protein [Pseudomonadota bacterium]
MDERLDIHHPRGFDAFELTLGDEMRGERATLGKSLLDVQRDLRIKATYIAAIENCDPSVFHTKGFIAGYVRSYARYLGMDADLCFLRFCEESGFDGVHPDLTRQSRSTAAPLTPVRPASADPIAKPRIPNTPQRPGLMARLSPQAFGSVAVIGVLLLGLGYGSWAVLQEVQRVQFVPVNQSPDVTAELPTLDPAVPNQRDTVVAIDTTNRTQRPANLDQLYRPQELDVPQMTPRDAPIASIEAGSRGAFADVAPPSTPRPQEAPTAPVTVAQGPAPVDVVAARGAWMRIYFDDGSVLFEKLMNAGESYRLPADVRGARLHAGNAGSVFVKVGETIYGPVGRPGGVVRNVDLGRTAVLDTFVEVQNVFDTPLDPPLNLDELLDPENAIVEAPRQGQ